MEAICQIARRLLHIQGAVIWLEESTQLWADLEGPDSPQPSAVHSFLARLPLGDGPTLIVEDLLSDPATAPFLKAPGVPCVGFAAILSLGKDRIAKLAIFDDRPRVLSDDEITQLQKLAAVATETLRLSAAVAEISAQERHFRLLAETSTDTIVRGNLEGVRLYISPSVKDLLGYEPATMIGRQAINITHPDDVGRFGALMAQIRAGTLDVGVIEIRQRHANGSWVWMEASVRLTYDLGSGNADGYVASVRSIERRKAAEETLAYLASHDDITGLLNRQCFHERLRQATETLGLAGESFLLLLIDVDRFKHINDTLGHQAGDEVLRQIAHRFREIFSPDDIVARTGGDEFSVICRMRGAREASEKIARTLVEAFARPITLKTGPLGVGVSVGIASAPHQGTDPDDLLSLADQALYRAKAAGRNTFIFS